jgi:2-alkenal reductase
LFFQGKNMKLFTTKLFWFGILISLLAISCNIFTPLTQTEPSTSSVAATASPLQMSSLPAITTDEESVLVELYQQSNPSVVNIITFAKQDTLVFQSGQGSGFVIDQAGHIVTNSHVIHGADEVEVSFSDSTVMRAKIVGEDLHSDLAVIKVSELPEGVQALELGKMEDLAVGQTVIAIGNPFGLGGTLTKGIISALGRTIPALTAFSIPQSIQTDAPINPGNSGGPLLNLKGEVIGVNAQIETDGGSRVNSGIGFAIPVSIMSKVIPDLIQKGETDWSWLGVSGRSLDPTLIEAMDLNINKGAYISRIVNDGPSERAGLQGATDTKTINGRQVEIGGDVIIGIDETDVNSFEDLLIYTALNTEPGQQVILTVIRDNQEKEIEVTVRKRPDSIDLTP